jgi:hypothetical protein
LTSWSLFNVANPSKVETIFHEGNEQYVKDFARDWLCVGFNVCYFERNSVSNAVSISNEVGNHVANEGNQILQSEVKEDSDPVFFHRIRHNARHGAF